MHNYDELVIFCINELLTKLRTEDKALLPLMLSKLYSLDVSNHMGELKSSGMEYDILHELKSIDY